MVSIKAYKSRYLRQMLSLQRWLPSLLPLVQRVREAQKMHALQHGIQNKRHIVNTKSTFLLEDVNPHCPAPRGVPRLC